MHVKQFRGSHMHTLTDLYTEFKLDSVSFKREYVKKYKCNSRKDLLGRMLAYLFSLIILDIIENNITFALPNTNHNVFLHLKPVTGEEFKYAYNKYKFREWDYVLSNFTAYALRLSMETRSGMREREIYLESKFADKIKENVYNGKQYF